MKRSVECAGQAIWNAKSTVAMQVEPGKPGAEVSKKKNFKSKNLPIECAQGDKPLRCQNRVV